MTVESMVQELIGCAWGRRLATPDDTEPCNEQAVQIVVLHDGDKEAAVKLCAAHRDRILARDRPARRVIHVVIIDSEERLGGSTKITVLGEHSSIAGIEYIETGDLHILKALERLPREIEKKHDRITSGEPDA